MKIEITELKVKGDVDAVSPALLEVIINEVVLPVVKVAIGD